MNFLEFTDDDAFALLRSTEEYPVDFEYAWRWIGYSRKDAAIVALELNCVQGEDFNFQDILEVRTEGRRKVTRKVRKYRLSIDGFKMFSASAGTPRGQEVRRYLIACEKRLKQILSQSAQWNDPDEEWAYHQQRYDIRIYLKDVLRPELMNLVIRWAEDHGQSPITVCSDVHDEMNLVIQGAKAQQIAEQGGIPLGQLLRDRYDTVPLLNYSGINKVLINAIRDEGMNPIDAVREAGRRYLGQDYQPELVPIVEPLHQERRRLKEARKRKALATPNQLRLDLFPSTL